MAGYVMTMNSEDALKDCIEKGYYSTNLSEPTDGFWRIPHEGTFTDYMSMKKGDNIYFFISRMLYGIGELTEINRIDCKFLNYPDAMIPMSQNFLAIKDHMILDEYENRLNNRLVCFFRASPMFFTGGIDMDDCLAYKPESFRMLRALWKLSFVKIDDEENKALKDIILKRNEIFLSGTNGVYNNREIVRHRASTIINENYRMNPKGILTSCSDGDYIKHEMALEAGVVYELSTNPNSIFGTWDYVSHQVIASPFKAIDYMDKMDVFGYRFIPNYDTISKYLIIEVKKGSATIEVVDQVMKYVDWVNQEYSNRDYSSIEAFIIAHHFPQEVIRRRDEICIRNYIKGRRPTVAETWSSVRLIQYRFDSDSQRLIFTEINANVE